jgi:hypothetical protein
LVLQMVLVFATVLGAWVLVLVVACSMEVQKS